MLHQLQLHWIKDWLESGNHLTTPYSAETRLRSHAVLGLAPHKASAALHSIPRSRNMHKSLSGPSSLGSPTDLVLLSRNILSDLYAQVPG